MNFVCNWLPFWLPLPFVLGIMLAGFLWPIVDLRPAMLKNIPRGISEVMKTWPLGDGEKPNFLRKPLSWQIMRPKGFHLLMFFLWSFLLFGALESVAGLPWWLAGLVALALSVGLGFFTEVAQASTGKRGGILTDVGINALASTLGVAAFHACICYVRHYPPNPPTT